MYISCIIVKAEGVYMNKHCIDQVFFEENVAPHYIKVIKFLIYSSQDKELAYDIVQDTMEAAWKYRNKIHSYDNIEAALITIAKNKLKKYYCKHPANISIEELEFNEVPDKTLVEEITMEVETGEEIRELFRTLDEKYARILILHYYYDLSLKEIAEMYGTNYNTVLSWHTRALKKLKNNCMKNEDFELYIK